jgi:hypothetical protein
MAVRRSDHSTRSPGIIAYGLFAGVLLRELLVVLATFFLKLAYSLQILPANGKHAPVAGKFYLTLLINRKHEINAQIHSVNILLQVQ